MERVVVCSPVAARLMEELAGDESSSTVLSARQELERPPVTVEGIYASVRRPLVYEEPPPPCWTASTIFVPSSRSAIRLARAALHRLALMRESAASCLEPPTRWQGYGALESTRTRGYAHWSHAEASGGGGTGRLHQVGVNAEALAWTSALLVAGVCAASAKGLRFSAGCFITVSLVGEGAGWLLARRSARAWADVLNALRLATSLCRRGAAASVASSVCSTMEEEMGVAFEEDAGVVAVRALRGSVLECLRASHRALARLGGRVDFGVEFEDDDNVVDVSVNVLRERVRALHILAWTALRSEARRGMLALGLPQAFTRFLRLERSVWSARRYVSTLTLARQQALPLVHPPTAASQSHERASSHFGWSSGISSARAAADHLVDAAEGAETCWYLFHALRAVKGEPSCQREEEAPVDSEVLSWGRAGVGDEEAALKERLKTTLDGLRGEIAAAVSLLETCARMLPATPLPPARTELPSAGKGQQSFVHSVVRVKDQKCGDEVLYLCEEDGSTSSSSQGDTCAAHTMMGQGLGDLSRELAVVVGKRHTLTGEASDSDNSGDEDTELATSEQKVDGGGYVEELQGLTKAIAGGRGEDVYKGVGLEGSIEGEGFLGELKQVLGTRPKPPVRVIKMRR